MEGSHSGNTQLLWCSSRLQDTHVSYVESTLGSLQLSSNILCWATHNFFVTSVASHTVLMMLQMSPLVVFKCPAAWGRRWNNCCYFYIFNKSCQTGAKHRSTLLTSCDLDSISNRNAAVNDFIVSVHWLTIESKTMIFKVKASNSSEELFFTARFKKQTQEVSKLLTKVLLGFNFVRLLPVALKSKASASRSSSISSTSSSSPSSVASGTKSLSSAGFLPQ